MAQEIIHHNERVIQDPAIMVGKPVVKGTRIPVEVVLGVLARDFDLDELFAGYPDLTVEDVQAVMAYARDLVDVTYRRSSTRRKAIDEALAKA